MSGGKRARRIRDTGRGRSHPTGFSLVEVLIAITILSVGLLALGSAAGHSIRQSSLSAVDVEMWTDAERVADSLASAGWGNVTGGSETHTHYGLTWSVASPASNLDRVDLVITRWGAMGHGARKDTITVMLARAVP